MTLFLGGNYKTYFIGGPKNGRVVIIDPRSVQPYNFAVWNTKTSWLASSLDPYSPVRMKQVSYRPQKLSTFWNGSNDVYIFMVYENTKNITKNKTLQKLMASGRVVPV